MCTVCLVSLVKNNSLIFIYIRKWTRPVNRIDYMSTWCATKDKQINVAKKRKTEPRQYTCQVNWCIEYLASIWSLIPNPLQLIYFAKAKDSFQVVILYMPCILCSRPRPLSLSLHQDQCFSTCQLVLNKYSKENDFLWHQIGKKKSLQIRKKKRERKKNYVAVSIPSWVVMNIFFFF